MIQLSDEDKLVRSKLIEFAKKEKTIGYQMLCNKCGLDLKMSTSNADRIYISKVLDKISNFERDFNRPLLSAIVENFYGHPGNGFFRMSERNWNLSKSEINKLIKNGLHEEHQTDVFIFWTKKENSIYIKI